ncbi:extracellular solute-binding protein [Bdellovibrio svalbardensis]|uniref:Extracellular solute-binding protein n=1 Tax=Bdellovibrio svalbardensis TaxID=2972972 RepID=A0ABT6DK24_9BACT|nr:extracellular solute-binding protein [Bdellovibrio svalbardensis]MDG0817226.1 extracellular solute-binding protein [Bdellovibrio svalbardensis]
MRASALLLILFSSLLAHAKPVHINVWHQMIYGHRQVLAEALKKFEKENPDITVQATYRETEELRSSYQSAAMGGAGPELVYGPSDQIGPFATMGIIRPLDTVLEKADFSALDPLATPEFMNQHYMVGDGVGNHLMLIYNKKLIQTPPKNTDELIEMGRRLTIDQNGDGKVDQWGLVFNYTEPFFFAPFISAFGDDFIKNDSVPNLNTPALRSTFQFILDMRDKYKIIPKECDYETANALFKGNKAAMLINGDWSWGDYKEAKVDFGIARIPMISSTGRWPSPLVGTKGYSLNVNMKSPEHLAAAIKLLKFLTSESTQLLFAEKVGILPSNLNARNSEIVKNNPLLKISSSVMEVGHPMPIAPEIRAIWDSLRTQYQKVLAGSATPELAAKSAQEVAEKQIHEMNEVLEPTGGALVLKILFAIILICVAWLSRKSFAAFVNGFQGPQKFAYYMMLPAFLGIFAVIVYPFFYNIAISFSNFSLRTFQDWSIVGFQHYAEALTDPRFYSLFLKTVIWTVVNVVFHVSIGVFLAIIINQVMPAKGFWRALLIIPWAVPQYITALTWRALFNQEYGPINIFLQQFMHLSPVQWLSQPFTAFAACVITNVWLGFPFMMIVALGGLQSIPHSLYEAAVLDGANAWQRFRHITWPLLLPVMVPAALLGSIWTFNNLNVIWLVSNSGEPGDQTHILVSYVYKAAFNLYRYGYAAAVSVLIFLILVVWGLSSLKAQYRKETQ